MAILKKLAKEVSKCRGQGNLRGKGYPTWLRKKIYSAVQKYGLAKTGEAIGVSRTVIGRWPVNSSPGLKTKKSSLKENRPIIFQELPPKQSDSLATPSASEGVFLQLTSPTGYTIALNGNPGPETTSGIIRAFMGGL